MNRAITRPATGSITFRQPYQSYMQSFVKIGVLVLEKNANETMTLRNFNKDTRSLNSTFILALSEFIIYTLVLHTSLTAPEIEIISDSRAKRKRC